MAPRYSRARMRASSFAQSWPAGVGCKGSSLERFSCVNYCRKIYKIEIEHLTRDEATKAASYLAAVVGQAHARQTNPSMKKNG